MKKSKVFTKTNKALFKETKYKAINHTSKALFMAAAVVSILAVIAIFVFLFLKGMPAFQKIGFFKFVFGSTWNSNSFDTFAEPLVGTYGIFTMIVGSIFATVGALIVGGTLGYFTAVYLAKFCPKKLKKILTSLINLLAGIPSIVYGFFGMKILLPVLGQFSPNGDGGGILAVSIILGIMILPTIVALSKTSIEAVPDSYYEGARALGSSHEQAVFKAVVPAAKSGIVASFILGVGRAIGETMAVVMVAGNSVAMPNSLFSSFRTMTANVVLEMGYAGEVQMSALIATGVILLLFIVCINLLFNLVREKDSKAKKKFSFLGFNKLFLKLSKSLRKKSSMKSETKAIELNSNNQCNTNYDNIVGKQIFTEQINQPILKYDQIQQENNASQDIIHDEKNGKNEVEIGKKGIKKRLFSKIKSSKLYIAISDFMSNLILKFTRKFPKLKLAKFGKVMSITTTVIATLSLISIIGFILANGLPHINWSFLSSDYEYGGAISIFPSIIATLMLVFLCVVLAIPLGIMTAIYLHEYTKRGSRMVKIVRGSVEILAGVPSIVYGLFGMIFFCNLLGLGTSILAGALTVSIMILPTVVRETEESLIAVSDSFREGSLALGAGKLRTIFKVVLPSALPGILSAVILSIGRVVSESAPLIFTMGASLKPLPQDGFKSSGTSLAVALYKLAGEGLHVNEAYATACVLILIVLTLNLISGFIVKRLQRKLGSK